ncbi:MAG: TetR/AcrR family transcriptional regulator [Pseudomonadota bacterium]
MPNEFSQADFGDGSTRQRILEAAYALFLKEGVASVGIESILSRAGCARASLYSHFGSKEALAIAVMELHFQRWVEGWLERSAIEGEADPERQLLAKFDLVDEWFNDLGFAGCAFVKILLETPAEDPVHKAAAENLARIREMVRDIAERAQLDDPEGFSFVWHMLMEGSVVTATGGVNDAGSRAKAGAQMLLRHWPRASGS